MSAGSSGTTRTGAGAGGNVDPGEIAHFDRLAARWWDPRGEMQALHVVNGPRLRYIARCARRPH